MRRKRDKGWCIDSVQGRLYTSAWTKGEARAKFKAMLGISRKSRLPVNVVVAEI